MSGLLVAGCFPTDKGPSPPPEQLYFPTGLAVSPGGKALFVASSDFDLQYKAGTVVALDLERLRSLVPRPPALPAGATTPGAKPPEASQLAIDCAKYGLAANAGGDALLYPGPCSPIDINNPPDGKGSLVKTSVNIGAFATDAVILRREPDSDKDAEREVRLLVPVRGDPSLTWLTIDDDGPGLGGAARGQSFRMDCGQAGGDNRCDQAHQAGTDPTDNTRELTMPTEPFLLAAGERTDTILVTHQSSGAVSLFLNGWTVPKTVGASPCAKAPKVPTLAFVLSGLPLGASGVVALPRPKLAKLYPDEFPYSPAFLVSYRSAAEIDLVRYLDDCASAPSRPFLSVTARSGVGAAAGGFDSRGIAIDARTRKACEDACSVDDKACLSGCAGVPVDIFVANRTPPSLLLGTTTGSISQNGTDDYVAFHDLVPLSEGASTVKMGTIIDRDGNPKPRVFVLCFDARLLYVYDPDARAMEAVIKTGRGPSALELDPGVGSAQGSANFAYVAHFTDSYLGVIDLDMRNPSTYLTLVANVGVPVAPREAK